MLAASLRTFVSTTAPRRVPIALAPTFKATTRSSPRAYSSSSSGTTPPAGKSVPASSPGVSSTPSPEEALSQGAQTSADELEPIAAQTQARMKAAASSSSGRTEEVAESRPTVEEAKAEHQPIDIARAAPDLARKTGQS